MQWWIILGHCWAFLLNVVHEKIFGLILICNFCRFFLPLGSWAGFRPYATRSGVCQGGEGEAAKQSSGGRVSYQSFENLKNWKVLVHILWLKWFVNPVMLNLCQETYKYICIFLLFIKTKMTQVVEVSHGRMHAQNHGLGWVGLWGFLWWAPSAKRKDHHGVSSGWSSVWHRSNTGLSSTQYEQIPNYTWGLAILADSLRFSVNNILAGLWLNCISSVEITLFLQADILLQHRALFQC